MGPFARACQPERYCTAGTHGTENSKSYRASGALQLPAQRPPQSRGWGIFFFPFIYFVIFFFAPPPNSSWSRFFISSAPSEALVRVSCFFVFFPPRPGETWAGVAACSRCDRWGNNLDAHNTKLEGGGGYRRQEAQK